MEHRAQFRGHTHHEREAPQARGFEKCLPKPSRLAQHGRLQQKCWSTYMVQVVIKTELDGDSCTDRDAIM